jgi:hypothetical protein
MAERKRRTFSLMERLPGSPPGEDDPQALSLEGGMTAYQWARLQERLLAAQLSVLRKFLAEMNGLRMPRSKRRSQINLIREILEAADGPLHISEIIQRAAEKYGMALDRESVVSAIAKKVKKGVTFERVGPNTFGLRK